MNVEPLRPMANHLWQSTLFAAAAGSLTLALRKNRARVRHRVWLAASCKFLIPLSGLIAVGSHLSPPTAPAIAPSRVIAAAAAVGAPFVGPGARVPEIPIAPVPVRSPFLNNASRLMGMRDCLPRLFMVGAVVEASEGGSLRVARFPGTSDSGHFGFFSFGAGDLRYRAAHIAPARWHRRSFVPGAAGSRDCA